MKNYTFVAIALVAVVGGAVYLTQPVQQTKGIKIGALLSITGSAASDAEQIKRGIDMAKADLATRGVNVDIVIEDDGTDAKKTVSAFEKLATVDTVDFIIGPTWSFLGDAAAPSITRTGVTTFAPALTSEYSTSGETIFFGSLKNSERASSIATWMREQNIKKVAVIVDNGSWGLSILPAFKEAAQRAGVEVVYESKVQPFSADPVEVARELAQVKARGADAILMSGYQEFTTLLMKRSQEMELNMPILITQQFAFKLVKDGTITPRPSDKFFVSYAGTSDEFASKYQAVYGEAPGEYADRAYDGVMLMVEAQQKKGTQTLSDYVRSVTSYKGFAGTYTFDAKGDIVGGEWVIRPVVQ
jgi:branched-chain amino acid transport system substrate-binding protein